MPQWTPKTNGQWDRMSYVRRHDWLAGLDDAQLVAQAGVRAGASGRSTSDVLRTWVQNGMVDRDRAKRLIAALAEVAS